MIVPLAGKEADRAILAKNSVRIYTILRRKDWLCSERMKHGEADCTLQGKEIKCEKNAKPLGFAPFCDAFIVELTLLTNKSFRKKSALLCHFSLSG